MEYSSSILKLEYIEARINLYEWEVYYLISKWLCVKDRCYGMNQFVTVPAIRTAFQWLS